MKLKMYIEKFILNLQVKTFCRAVFYKKYLNDLEQAVISQNRLERAIATWSNPKTTENKQKKAKPHPLLWKTIDTDKNSVALDSM